MTSIVNFSFHKIYWSSFKLKLFVYSHILQNENINSLTHVSRYRRYCKQQATTKKEKKKLKYNIESATMNDIPEIIELIRSVYIPNDPVIKSYKFNEKTNQQVLEELKLALYEDIAAGYTIIAKNPVRNLSPQIYSVCNCGIRTPETYNAMGKRSNVEDTRLRHLFRLWHYIAEKPCLFNKFGVDEVFELSFGTTHPIAQNQGIGTNLIKEAINLARKKGIKLVRIDASSFFTSSMCMKLGMKEVHNVYFNEYVDEQDNRKLCKIEHPHKSFSTFVMDLRPKSE